MDIIKNKHNGGVGVITSRTDKTCMVIVNYEDKSLSSVALTAEVVKEHWTKQKGDGEALLQTWIDNESLGRSHDVFDHLANMKLAAKAPAPKATEKEKALPFDTAKVVKPAKGQELPKPGKVTVITTTVVPAPVVAKEGHLKVKIEEPTKPTLQERIAAKRKETKLSPKDEAGSAGQSAAASPKKTSRKTSASFTPEPKPAPKVKKTEPKSAPKAKKPEPKPTPKAKKPEPKPVATKSTKAKAKPAPKPVSGGVRSGSVADRALGIMVRGRKITVSDIAIKLKEDPNNVRQAVFQLKNKGLVEQVDRGVYTKL